MPDIARPSTLGKIEIEIEFAEAQRNLMASERAALQAAGIAPGVIDELVGAANVDLSRDRAEFWPSESGPRCFIIAARGSYSGGSWWRKPIPFSANPAWTVRAGEIVDLVAFRPDCPARWALRCGSAQWLGATELRRWGGPAVEVWRSPLGWLRAGARGLVILTRGKTDARELLHRFRSIDGEDAAHVRELVKLRDLPPRGPAIGALRRHA